VERSEPAEPGTPATDREVADQLQRVIHRVKQSMNYRGSHSTRDILGALVARWVTSGEWERLKTLPQSERHLGESVRRFILDRLASLRRRGDVTAADEPDFEAIAIPDEPALEELIAMAELRAWVAARVADLAAGKVDPRVRIPPGDPAGLGAILERHLAGKSQREIASELAISVGLVNKRIADGTRYFVLLQGIDGGLV
jgi:hypothetical protein